MDQSVIDFYNANKDLKHNKDVLDIPEEFLNASSDEEIERFFKWIRHESKCKSLLLDIQTDVSELKEELKDKYDLAVPHRHHTGWRSITLFGYSSIMTNSYEHYKERGFITDNDVPSWTDICKLFPKTVEWVKKYSPIKEYARVRIMVLDPGGVITPHKDYLYGQVLASTINIAVINPPGVEFVLENGGTVPWEEGQVRLIDVGSVHSVRNTSTSPRVHLIITPTTKDWDIEGKRTVCRNFIRYQKERYDTRGN